MANPSAHGHEITITVIAKLKDNSKFLEIIKLTIKVIIAITKIVGINTSDILSTIFDIVAFELDA